MLYKTKLRPAKRKKREKKKVRKCSKKQKEENNTHIIPDSLVESKLFPQYSRKPYKITKGNSGQNKIWKQNAEVHCQHCKDKNLNAKGQKLCDVPCKPGFNACAKEWQHTKGYNEDKLKFDNGFFLRKEKN